jgi:ketosteroid isomerase-like protein
MNDRPASDGGAILIVAILVLVLLPALGIGFFFFRQQTLARQAHIMAVEARLQADAAQRSLRQEKAKQSSHGSVRQAIEMVLQKQQAAWNAGNIDEFMDYYWKSADLTFSSAGQTTRGWEATLTSYKSRYPTPEQMGKVSFADIEVMPLGDSAALVLGTWHLDRAADPLKGSFSLVFRHIGGRWLIVHDHTSRLIE